MVEPKKLLSPSTPIDTITNLVSTMGTPNTVCFDPRTR